MPPKASPKRTTPGGKSPAPAGKSPAAKSAGGKAGAKSPQPGSVKGKSPAGARSPAAPSTKGPAKAGAKSPAAAGNKSPAGAKSPAASGAKAAGSRSPGPAGKAPGKAPAGSKSPGPKSTVGAKSPGPKTVAGGKSPAPAGSKTPTGAKTPAGAGAKSPSPAGGLPKAASKSPTPASKAPTPASKAPTPAPVSKAPTPAAQPAQPTPSQPDETQAEVEVPEQPPADSVVPAPVAEPTQPQPQPTPVPSSPAPTSYQGTGDTTTVLSDTTASPSMTVPSSNRPGGAGNITGISPIPGSPTGPGGFGSPSSASFTQRRASPPRRTAAKKPTGPLTVDPRSGLPLIEVPPDRQHAFASLGGDMLLHVFIDCDRISSKGKPLRRVLFITDQTLFICEETGSVMRCIQVSKINQVNVAADNSNEIALVVPSEYDVVLRLDRKQHRDDVLVILRAVYKRMVDSTLNVQMVKEIRPNQYRMDKPPGFQLQRIPQRTRTHLQRALDAIEQQESERLHAITSMQSQLEGEHKQELQNKQQELGIVGAKLDEARSRLRQQQEELEKLRSQFAKCKKRVEEIDGQYGPNGEAPQNKDQKIRELQDVVESLTASVAKANDERARAEQIRRAGDFDERDLDHMETDGDRVRGRSLHQQGLVEVLQRQLEEKQKELSELATKQIDLQKLNLELHKKEDVLRELEQAVPTNRMDDPNNLYASNAGGTSVEELLNKFPGGGNNTTFGGGGGGSSGIASSPIGGGGSHVDPMLNFASPVKVADKDLGQDEDGEAVYRGSMPSAGKLSVTGKDMPEFRLPSDEKDFRADPRTGLRFVDVPVGLHEQFKELLGSIIHFFAVGTKSNKRGREQKRVIVLSDQSLFQCTSSGNINRCLWITSIHEVIVDSQANVALLVDGKNEYDLSIRFETTDVCEELVEVVKRTSAFLKRNPPLKVTRIERINASGLKLEKPPAYEFALHPIRAKRNLYRALHEIGKTSAEERARIHDQADQYTLDVINKIKEDLKDEIGLRREHEFSVLRQQLSLMDGALREKQLEVRNLRRQIADHKCSVDHVKIAQQSAEVYEVQGMYWVPSDPVVMECDLEVLHIQFHDSFVVTSHPNGFLNVWDISNADLFRTLKVNGHTAKVTAFHFNGRDIVSGGHDSSLRRWDIMQGQCTKVIHNAQRGAVTGVQFDALHLVSSGTDGVLNVWDVSKLKHIKSLKGHKSGITCFKFERNMLASAEWGWIFLWDMSKGIIVKALRDDNGGIGTLDLHNMTLLSGGTGGSLTVWNLHTGEGEALEGHTDDIHCVQLQGNFAVSSSSDCTVRMWNVKDMTSLGIFHNSYPHESKKFHFKANRFVVGEYRTIKVWTR